MPPSSTVTTQAIKKAVEKAVKKGAVAMSRPFKKRFKSSSESVGEEENLHKFFLTLRVRSFTYN